MDAVPELELEGVRKERPGSGGASMEVLRGVDLAIRSRELTAIIGPSGGGKSTLVRLLNRLEEPTAGRIRFRGKDLDTIPPLDLRRQIGLVLQKPFMFAGSVLDNLQRPFSYRGMDVPGKEDPDLARVLERCGLAPELLGREARNLSVGQQQRVSLARTLLPRPSVLVLDEPTSALDRPTADRLASTLRIICRRERITVLMVTHDLRLASRAADTAAYLADGRILEAGPAARLLKEPETEQLRRFLAGTEEAGSEA